VGVRRTRTCTRLNAFEIIRRVTNSTSEPIPSRVRSWILDSAKHPLHAGYGQSKLQVSTAPDVANGLLGTRRGAGLFYIRNTISFFGGHESSFKGSHSSENGRIILSVETHKESERCRVV
jgi:hypothetical protein